MPNDNSLSPQTNAPADGPSEKITPGLREAPPPPVPSTVVTATSTQSRDKITPGDRAAPPPGR